MSIAVIMPRQGQSVESCLISKWHKKKGDKVRPGDILFSYETDKAGFDEEAKVEGIIMDIFFNEGDDVPVLKTVCIIGKEGEVAGEYAKDLSVAQDAPVADAGAGQAEKPGATQGRKEYYAGAAAGEIRISPRARKLAEELGINYSKASGSGPEGRIIEKDIYDLREKGMAATYAASSDIKGMQSSVITGTGIGGRITTEDLSRAAARTTAQNADQDVSRAAAQATVQVSEQTTAKASDMIVEQTAVQIAEQAAVQAAAQTATQVSTQSAAQTSEKVRAQAAVKPDAQPVTQINEQGYSETKLSGIRKVIAKAMLNSLSSMAQLTINSSFDATDILALRKKFKENREKLGIENITLNDIILYAVSRTLMKHKSLNANMVEDKMLIFDNVNLGIAVDTDRGLLVPNIFNANLKSLNEISKEAKLLAEGCQKGNIKLDLLKGGSFTVTNLGTLDVESFTPVINPPQTGILGVDTIVQRVRETAGCYEYYPAMGLSLTFDHRAIDGAPAARFLKDLKQNLENFSLLLTQ